MSQSCLPFLSFILRKKKDIRLYKFGRGDEPEGLGNTVKASILKKTIWFFHYVSLCKAFKKAL